MMFASTPTTPRSTGRRWPIATAASAGAGLVYLNSLHNPFVYDDHRVILDNASLAALPNLSAIAAHDMTRPLVNLTYALDWTVWGLDPFGFHVTNVLLHMVNVLLVFALARRLALVHGATASQTGAASPDFVGAACALIFAINPMMTQAVGYVSGRPELLCGAFMLTALLSAARYHENGKAQWWLVSLAAWLTALVSKEVAVMLPLILFAADRLVWSKDGLGPRLRHLYVPMLGIAAAVVALRLWVLRAIEYSSDGFEPTYLLVQVEAIGRYAWLLLGQGPQSIFHQIAPYDDLLTPRALLVVAALVLVPTLGWRWRTIDRLTTFGLVWFLLCLLPSSALFILGRGEAMAEHRAYVASIGFFLAASSLLDRFRHLLLRQKPRTRRLAATVAVVLLAQLALHTVLRNATWSSPVVLWQDAASRAPGHWLPRLMLGESFREAGRCEEAVPEYRTAIAGNPDEAIAYTHLGSCLLTTNQLAEASQVFSIVDTKYPESGEGPAGLALVAVAEERLDAAQGLLRESLNRNGASAPVRQLLASLEARNDLGNASELCHQLQALMPMSKPARECQPTNGARP